MTESILASRHTIIKMEKENVFGQLRRIARNVQNETALAQERMSRPLALRASGDSARPVLRRMQADAHNVKLAAGEAESGLSSSGEFNKLLESCSQLCDSYRSKVNILEGYLQQYGYQPQQVKVKGVPVSSKGKKDSTATEIQKPKEETHDAEEMKENIPATPTNKLGLGSSWKGDTPRLEDFGLSRNFLEQVSKSKHQSHKEPQEITENCQQKDVPKMNPTTPAKNPDIVLPVAGDTPKLEDFGLSSNFLENISKNRHHNQHGNGPTLEGAPLNSTYDKKQMEMARTPMHPPSQSTACPFTPIGVTTTPSSRVTVTPGMFGGSELPDETPTKFIDLASGLPRSHAAPVDDSSRPQGAKKSLLYKSSSKNGAASVLDAIPNHLAENKDQFGSPQPPELTARWNFTSVQASLPNQPDFTLGPQDPPHKPEMLGYRTDTPPTPEMTARWNTGLTSKALSNLPSSEPSFILEEPIRLTSHEPTQTPEEPQRLYVEKPTPSLDDMMPQTPLGLPGGIGNSRFMPEEMPKTPELTMLYPRYIDPGTNVSKLTVNNVPQEPTASIDSGNPHTIRVEESSHSFTTEPQDISYVSMVTDEEFSKQSAHMRRILPLNLVNETVSCMNTILNIKHKQGEGVFLTDDDVQVLGLGPKSKAILLFFITVKRLSSGKRPGTSEVAYYPVA